jgi:hypothetical protein
MSNSKPDPNGGSAIEVIHGAGHSAPLGDGHDRRGHQHQGVMMDGNDLVPAFRTVGATGIIQQNNDVYKEAMMARYGTAQTESYMNTPIKLTQGFGDGLMR